MGAGDIGRTDDLLDVDEVEEARRRMLVGGGGWVMGGDLEYLSAGALGWEGGSCAERGGCVGVDVDHGKMPRRPDLRTQLAAVVFDSRLTWCGDAQDRRMVDHAARPAHRSSPSLSSGTVPPAAAPTLLINCPKNRLPPSIVPGLIKSDPEVNSIDMAPLACGCGVAPSSVSG